MSINIAHHISICYYFDNTYSHIISFKKTCFVKRELSVKMRRKIALKPGQPEKIHIQLSHYKQKYNWDCGVSCVLMVLSRKNRHEFLKNFAHICKSEGFNKSTWTIDLCYLLKKYNVEHVFYTITLGVHEGYRGNSFYNNVLTKDEHRVKTKFKDAANVGIYVKKKSVTLVDILAHLVNGPVIVLTNARVLSCDICKFNKISSELRKCIPWPSTYQGHYVVICGYDIHTRKVFYRNPSFGDHVCLMSLESLDQARKCYGTDEDIIFIFN
ncbi:protein GUCD1 isoform X1 [Anoplophora glabripennis]|uniref:protein GUCD1 isoform X1 n=1 Tax=Anoplophora glabripennis TaxID=217634 RepID=UPI000873ADEA|nr:protein GUCD1 isoform X1 [Anoplophora glabripennis]